MKSPGSFWLVVENDRKIQGQTAASVIGCGAATTFQITFDPAAMGSFTDTVTIANNDADESPYTFVISGTGTVATAAADLAISQSLSHDFLDTIFTIVAQNDGPDDAPGAVVSVTFPAEITNVTWTCAGSGGASCANSGSGNTIHDTLGNFPNSGVVTYTVRMRVLDGSVYTNAAEVMPPAGVTDPDPSNNYSEQTTRYLILLPLILKDASLTPAP
ncbi:MAG: hypothetical protein GWP17_02810 [Aquificales bacterium]|nr:hypothetical protein [Aquificales bacterium]